MTGHAPPILAALIALASAAPAWANDGTAVPEGSHVTLFALGLLGVIVGRRASINGPAPRAGEGAATPTDLTATACLRMPRRMDTLERLETDRSPSAARLARRRATSPA
jgi:hypothetical protein